MVLTCFKGYGQITKGFVDDVRIDSFARADVNGNPLRALLVTDTVNRQKVITRKAADSIYVKDVLNKFVAVSFSNDDYSGTNSFYKVVLLSGQMIPVKFATLGAFVDDVTTMTINGENGLLYIETNDLSTSINDYYRTPKTGEIIENNIYNCYYNFEKSYWIISNPTLLPNIGATNTVLKSDAHGFGVLGATGGGLMAKMLAGLEATDGQFGLQTMCIGHGMATATIIERI